MRIALLQLTSGDDPIANAEKVAALGEEAIGAGAEAIFTPEVTNCVSLSRSQQSDVLVAEAEDQTLHAMTRIAQEHGIWVNLGSLALADEGRRFRNRGFVISPLGDITARYDKLHMFDVAISKKETFRESDAFAPGDTAVVTEFASAQLGLSICYDLRFAALFRALAKAGADIISVPAAFSPETGVAHWEVLLRARAIETGCFIIAAAQSGVHPARHGRQRRTWGHSMVVAPWGEVVACRPEGEDIVIADIDLGEVGEARRRIPSLTHDRDFRVIS